MRVITVTMGWLLMSSVIALGSTGCCGDFAETVAKKAAEKAAEKVMEEQTGGDASVALGQCRFVGCTACFSLSGSEEPRIDLERHRGRVQHRVHYGII